MYKKLLIILCMFFIIGCTNENINTLTLEEIVYSSISSDGQLYNTNNICQMNLVFIKIKILFKN